MKKTLYLFLIVTVMSVVISFGCSSSSSSDDSDSTTGTTVTGTLYQPNGTDPLPGALLYIPQSSSASISVEPTKSSTLVVGTDCEAVPSTATAAYSTCSGADGTFSFTITDCDTIATTSGAYTVNYKKGVIAGTISLTFTCSESAQTVATTSAETTATEIGSAENLTIAVCSGDWDRMEEVLGRMGFAPSDSDSDATPNYNGWDGTVNSNFNYFQAHDESYGTYDSFPSCCSLLKGNPVAITDINGDPVTDSEGSALSRSITDYDIVFLNCGNGCEPDAANGAYTTAMPDALTDFSESNIILQNFVSNGGALYVTDLSYDFVEQAFPNQIDFLLGTNTGSTAEVAQIAQHGIDGGDPDNDEDGGFEPLTSTVNETALQTYLSSVSASNTACGTPSGTGSLNLDNTVNLCDFLGSWAVMVGLETANTATNWVQGAAEFLDGPDINAAGVTVTSGTTAIPLTVSFPYENGHVLYTSYHTNNENEPTTEFLPQERILQFLILDVLGNL